MNIELQGVILECRDIPRLLHFYTELLHWPVVIQEKNFVSMASPKSKVEIAFQCDKDYVPPVWPTLPNQQQMMAHLDFSVPTRNDLQVAADAAVNEMSIIHVEM